MPHFFSVYLSNQALIVQSPGEADFLVLPFLYEIIFDYKPHQLAAHGFTPDDIPQLKQQAQALDELSVRLQKPLIVFFYRDATVALPFKNALVFRTSGYASQRRKGEWGMPAFIERKPRNTHWQPRQKQPVPAVSFRGRAAPATLSLSVSLREQANTLLARLGFGFRVKNYQPWGYLLRRRAVRACQKAQQADKGLQTNFLLNPGEAATDDYLASFRQSDYIICAAGFGNYSYRLYETLREGRIPVYIDTDELLPCADRIAWRELMVWVPANRVDQTADYILAFHNALDAAAFVQRQHTLRHIFETCLTPQAFPRYLVNDFLPGILKNGIQ